ncbi:hypothetical protein MVEN_00216700 [Mycena venus]|uniref:Uncharacterized protein n=1 Tax=Mycena venus TaxID=2733690 RepID=A0A8H7DDF6_9AGAR|nr:hypothetical protein MVEN_00216700 [Mycena venus]
MSSLLDRIFPKPALSLSLSHAEDHEIRVLIVDHIRTRLDRKNFRPRVPRPSRSAWSPVNACSTARKLSEGDGDSVLGYYQFKHLKKRLPHFPPAARETILKALCQNAVYDHIAYCGRTHECTSYTKAPANALETAVGTWARERTTKRGDIGRWVGETFDILADIAAEVYEE